MFKSELDLYQQISNRTQQSIWVHVLLVIQKSILESSFSRYELQKNPAALQRVYWALKREINPIHLTVGQLSHTPTFCVLSAVIGVLLRKVDSLES